MGSTRSDWYYYLEACLITLSVFRMSDLSLMPEYSSILLSRLRSTAGTVFPVGSRSVPPGRLATDELSRHRLGAGLTWWIEAMGWWRGGVDDARHRILAGPPGQSA
jgi:hypothetical protein